MSAIQDLTAKIAAAEVNLSTMREELAVAKADAKLAVITNLVEQIIAHDISVEDLFPAAQRPAAPAAAAAPRARKRVEPKYRNPLTGETWTGRGMSPAWIVGKDKEDQFLITTRPTPGTAPSGQAAPADLGLPTTQGEADLAVAQADAPKLDGSLGTAAQPGFPALPADAAAEDPEHPAKATSMVQPPQDDHAPSAGLQEREDVLPSDSHSDGTLPNGQVELTPA